MIKLKNKVVIRNTTSEQLNRLLVQLATTLTDRKTTELVQQQAKQL